MIVAIMTTALAGTVKAQTVSVNDVLWSEPFAGNPSSATQFTETTSWDDYLNPTTFVASDASSLSYTTSKAMANSGTATNMTDAHVWLNKSVDSYIQVSGIKLYNSTKVKVSWAQANSQSLTTVYYQFDNTGDFVSLSSCSGPNANFESAELSVANHTTIALKFFHPSSNAKNTRIDNLKLTATGVASSTPTCETPTFSPAAGVFTSAQSVTISTETDGATIHYTTDGTDPTTSSSVYSSAISVNATTTIKAIAVKTGMDNSSVASATYTIVNFDHAGTADDPYTVADARAAIDAGTGTQGVYATGVVSEIVTAYDSGFGNITFDIIDEGGSNTLRAYRCGGSEAANVQVGDIVVVSGDLTLFNSIYEFTQGCQLVSRVHPTVPAILADNVILAYNATSGEITYTIDNSTGATLTAALTTGDWISNVTVDATNNKVTFTATANEGNADRTATITLSYTGAQDKVITVTQKHYVVDYAELPFAYDGNGSGTLPVGLTQSGLGTYNSSPAMKFDTTGDELILKINERPGVLSFDIKGNTFSGGTFKVQTSVDGNTYTDLETYTELGSTQSEEFSNLDANVRYIKWVYTNKSSGNVALGNIALAKYVYNPPVINANNTVALAFDATEGEIPYTIDYAVDGVSLTATENADWISNIAVTANKVTFNTTANEGEARNATITLSYEGADDKEVTVTQAAYVPPFASTTWTLATSITSGKHYIIVGMNNNDAYAMGEQNSNNRAAVDVDIEDETATVSSADVQEFVIYGPDAKGFYTIYDGTGYLYAASSGSNYLRTETTLDDNGKWSIVFDGNNKAAIKAQGTNTHNWMLFNTSGLFSCYANTSNSVNDNIYLYEKDGEATPTESKTLNGSGYATYASQNALDFTNADGFTAWAVTEISGTTITFSQITGSVPAGTGMLLKGTPSGSATMTSATGATALTSNLLIGTTADFTVENNGDYYGLKGASFVPVAKSTVPAGKALLSKEAVEGVGGGVKAFTFVFEEDDATAIEMVNGQSSMVNGPIYNLAGQRISKMQKGINIVNGKKILK